MRKDASLPLTFGGQGLFPFSHTPPAHQSNPPINQQCDFALTYHHASFVASWSSRRAVSKLGCPPSERTPSLPSLIPLPTHPLYLRSKLRFSTHGWPSMSHLHDCSPTLTDLTYPLITPAPPSSIHSWMVRTCPRLNCQILLTSSPTIPLLITRAASSLLLSLTFNPSHLPSSAGCRLLPCCLPRHFGCVSNRVRHGQGVTPRWLRLAWTVGMACWNA